MECFLICLLIDAFGISQLQFLHDIKWCSYGINEGKRDSVKPYPPEGQILCEGCSVVNLERSEKGLQRWMRRLMGQKKGICLSE